MDFINSISAITDVTASILKRIRIKRISMLGIEFKIEDETESIDERIKKIEVAKINLVEGLAAIEELEKQAAQNQKDAQDALKEIQQLQYDKSSLEQELESITDVIKSDVTAFKKVAGIPSNRQIKRERVVGFITGIVTSLIASGLIWFGIYLFNLLTK